MEWAWKQSNSVWFTERMSGQVTGNPDIPLKIFKIMYGCILFNISLTLHLTWRFCKARCALSNYSRLPITQTLANLNLTVTQTKSISPGFPSHILCNFTLDNSNLLLTKSNFCFPSDHFYTILPSITQTTFYSQWQVGKNNCTEVWNTEFFVPTLMSLQLKFSVCPCLLIKLCSLIPFIKYQSISLAALHVKCAWYLQSLAIYLLINFLISGYNLLQTPNNSNSQ